MALILLVKIFYEIKFINTRHLYFVSPFKICVDIELVIQRITLMKMKSPLA